MGRATDPVSRQSLALEVRSIWELQAFLAVFPLLRRAPHDDGHPVPVVPGLAASDVSTRLLRKQLGYAAHGWKPGQNRGPRRRVQGGIDARKASNAWQPNETLSGRQSADWPRRNAMKLPPPIPSTAIYNRTDGIVAWLLRAGCAGPLAGNSRQSAATASGDVAPQRAPSRPGLLIGKDCK